MTDPTPNIQELFKSLDAQYFAGLLSKNHVKVIWSFSLCIADAGMCVTYEEKNLIVIELNERLLKYRTRRDLVETLLVNE